MSDNRRLGPIEAVLKGHIYTITDYYDMGVIPADDIPHIMAEIERRWDAPAFREPGEES